MCYYLRLLGYIYKASLEVLKVVPLVFLVILMLNKFVWIEKCFINLIFKLGTIS